MPFLYDKLGIKCKLFAICAAKERGSRVECWTALLFQYISVIPWMVQGSRKPVSKYLLTVNGLALETQIALNTSIIDRILCYKSIVFILLKLTFSTGLQLGMNTEVILHMSVPDCISAMFRRETVIFPHWPPTEK